MMPFGGVVTVAQQKGGSGKTTLAATLAVGLRRMGARVALLDTDPQGSLGRWFMTRRDRLGDDPGLEMSTASAWGVSYETDKLRRLFDVVIVDTPPKVDSDLRPSLRSADLVIVPVAASHLDLWATEGVLDLCAREKRRVAIVLNRVKSRTRLSAEIAAAAADLHAGIATAQLGYRVAFAEAMGLGLSAQELPGATAAAREAQALVAEIAEALAQQG
ncbi:ParA family partition ATPase [Gemmobacter sp.]|uniref:ParA family partition ATPase n=1 Tax=Gemmobacter sp. TaxID=1898957 RepID=UPI002AFE84E5|nr:ParA family partition ATPase [Gemmobacter sp.]